MFFKICYFYLSFFDRFLSFNFSRYFYFFFRFYFFSLFKFFNLLLYLGTLIFFSEFKVSKYGAGYQIWFEAENYTSRTPDTDVHWKVEEIKNAYEKTVLGPTGNFGGMLRYEFDIRICGPEAKGGEWYFWARLVNPKNQSDFMLAEGHPTLWGTVKLIH